MIRFTACLLLAISMLGTAKAEETPQERDIAALRKAIIRSGEAFNAVDSEAILSPYARDVILSYPGVPDMNYETLAKIYGELRNRKPGLGRGEDRVDF
jgi:hypothetical protein